MPPTTLAAATAGVHGPQPARPRAPRKAAALARIAGVHAEVLDLIARGAPATLALDRIARLLDSVLAPGGAALVALDSERKGFAGVVAPNLPLSLANTLITPLEPQHGPAAAAILRLEPVWVTDCTRDDRWPDPLRAAVAHGFASITVQPLLNASGESLGVLALFHPKPLRSAAQVVTIIDAVAPMAAVVLEHDRRAQALRSADERLSSLAANLPGVIYQRIVHPDGKIRYTYISEGARDLFGTTPAEIIANPDALFSRHGPEYRATFRENLLAASRDLRMWDVEAQIVTRDGQEKWTHAKARPRRQSDGSVVWDGIILDATRIKQASLALAAANRAKSEFLATMSHELRTPLNAIIGFSEIILKESMGPIGNDHYREYLTDIHDSGTHLLSLINDILDLSKVEAGRLELDEGPIDVIHAIDSCIRLVKPRADDNRLAITVHCKIDKPELWGDERKFRQIVTNLLSNAVKFTPEGGSITIVVQGSPAEDLVVAITDTGIGIPAEALARVCQPFVQVDAGHSRKFEGTGLGLALSKALTEAHGGMLTIESTVGVGTRVAVSFPATRRTHANP